MSVPPELWTVNNKTYNSVSWTNTTCAFCDRSMNVLSVSYTVHISFVRYTSVTRTLVYRSFFFTCSICMRSLRLQRRHSPPLRGLPSSDKHFLHFFCSFGVRYPYLLSDCHTLLDSTNGRLTDSKILCSFVSVCMPFLSAPHAMNAFRVR